MVSINDVPADKLNQALVAELKSVKELTPPEWAMFIKTGAHRERPPVESDWWYIRTASILRTVYKDGPIGVSKLRSRYGGRRNRGTRPEKFTKGSGAIIRKILQQLQTAGFLETKGAGVHKGRIISKKGQSLLDKTSVKISKELKLKTEIKVVEYSAQKPTIKKKEVVAPEKEEKSEDNKKVAEKPKKEKSESKPKKSKKDVKE